MNEREFRCEVAAHKRKVHRMRTELQKRLARLGYYTRSPEDAERLARRLAMKH